MAQAQRKDDQYQSQENMGKKTSQSGQKSQNTSDNSEFESQSKEDKRNIGSGPAKQAPGQGYLANPTGGGYREKEGSSAVDEDYGMEGSGEYEDDDQRPSQSQKKRDEDQRSRQAAENEGQRQSGQFQKKGDKGQRR